MKKGDGKQIEKIDTVNKDILHAKCVINKVSFMINLYIILSTNDERNKKLESEINDILKAT